MRIRRLTRQDSEVVEFLQAMVVDMAAYGGHEVKNSDVVRGWFCDRISRQIESTDHLFLGAEPSDTSGQLLGILEASVAEMPPIFLPKRSLHISALYVVLEQRRVGVGRALMEAAFAWGREQGCVEADLNVLRNSPAKRLYEDLGFEPFRVEMRRAL